MGVVHVIGSLAPLPVLIFSFAQFNSWAAISLAVSNSSSDKSNIFARSVLSLTGLGSTGFWRIATGRATFGRALGCEGADPCHVNWILAAGSLIRASDAMGP